MTGEGEAARSTDRTGEMFERTFDDLAEVFQPDFTWSRRLASGVEATRSHIDRICAAVDHIQADDIAWSVAVASPSAAGRATTSRWKWPCASGRGGSRPRVRSRRTTSKRPWCGTGSAASCSRTIVWSARAYAWTPRCGAQRRRSAPPLPQTALHGGLRGRADLLIAADHASDSASAKVERFIEGVPEAPARLAGGRLGRRRALAVHRSLVEKSLAGELAELETSRVPDLQKKGRRAKIRRRQEVVRLRHRRIHAHGQLSRRRAHRTSAPNCAAIRPLCLRTLARRPTRRHEPTSFLSMLCVRRNAHGR